MNINVELIKEIFKNIRLYADQYNRYKDNIEFDIFAGHRRYSSFSTESIQSTESTENTKSIQRTKSERKDEYYITIDVRNADILDIAVKAYTKDEQTEQVLQSVELFHVLFYNDDPIFRFNTIIKDSRISIRNDTAEWVDLDVNLKSKIKFPCTEEEYFMASLKDEIFSYEDYIELEELRKSTFTVLNDYEGIPGISGIPGTGITIILSRSLTLESLNDIHDYLKTLESTYE